MILKLYTVRNIKKDVYNPPFVLEEEKYLREVILSALTYAKVDPQDLKDFEVHYLGDFDNTSGLIYDNSKYSRVLNCPDLMADYIEATNFETTTGCQEVAKDA